MSFSDPVGITSRWIAAARAIETRRPDRLFGDPWAEALAGDQGFELLQKLGSASRPPGAGSGWENPYLAIRTRFIDDFIVQQQEGLMGRQVVLVASGLDTRPHRLAALSGSRVFELDRGEVLEFKERVLGQAGVQARCGHRLLAVDLTRGFSTALAEHSFDPACPSVWIVEGLLPYLTETEAGAVLAECARLAAPESILVADLAGQSFLQSPWVQPFLRALEEVNAPWKFATDQPEAFFGRAGWQALARRPGEEGAHFGRWPYRVAPLGTPGVPQTFFITAVRSMQEWFQK